MVDIEFAISLPTDLTECLDECAREWNTTRNKAVQRLIIAALMAEVYRVQAEENRLEVKVA